MGVFLRLRLNSETAKNATTDTATSNVFPVKLSRPVKALESGPEGGAVSCSRCMDSVRAGGLMVESVRSGSVDGGSSTRKRLLLKERRCSSSCLARLGLSVDLEVRKTGDSL